MSIKIGPHLVPQMGYDQIQPGDLVCTYEALTTRPDLLAIQTLMKYSSLSQRPELNKMFHFEVITHKHPRLGMCRIAHANGGTQKVELQEDSFKDHHPGQALLVFRVDDEAIRNEIVAVATKTAELNNEHKCKILLLDSMQDRLRNIFRFFKFENFGRLASGRTIKNVAQIASNYEKTGRFYGEDGTGSREMSCVEYVANVVNVATARVLQRTTTEKTEAIFSQLRALKFSNPDSTPSSFVDFLLKNPSGFKTVGYLGAISQKIDGPSLDIDGEPIPTSLATLSKALSQMGEVQPDPLFAAKILKALGILNDSWQIYPKAANDPAKMKAFYSALYAHWGKSAGALQYFDQRLALFLKHVLQGKREEESPQIGSLSFDDQKQVLLHEKEFLKLEKIDRTKKTLKMSINALQLKYIDAEKVQSTANRIFDAGRVLMKTIVLFPISLCCSLAGRVINRIAAGRKEVVQKTRYEILAVHEKVRKNGRITLLSNIGNENRPWVYYSIDGGKTWDQEPFRGRDVVWDAFINVPEASNLTYKLFIGPKDIDDLDPLGKAITWQQTESPYGIFVPARAMKNTIENHTQYMMIDTCRYPNWGRALNCLQRSLQIFQYQQRCNAVAPQEQWPESIQAYEENYTKLEADLEPIEAQRHEGEDEIVGSLKTFIETKLGMNIQPEQIQFMKGGLGKGLSGDRIYRITDLNNDPILIVKVFMKSRGKFSREFYALMNHEQLKLEHLSLPTVMGIGKSQIVDRPIFFLAMNYISGISVYEMLTELLRQETGSPSRQESFKKLFHVYRKLGRALAGFHGAVKSAPRPMHRAFVDLLRAFSGNAIKKFQDHLEPSFVDKLRKFFDQRFEQECQKKFQLGYLHGDANAGNMMFNAKADQLSIIDWPDGSFSIGKNGAPMGISFYDLIQIQNELLMRKTQGLTENECSQLLDVFNNEYILNGGTLPSSESMKFFSYIDLMGSLKWFLDKKANFEQDQLKTAENIYQSKIAQLKALLEDEK